MPNLDHHIPFAARLMLMLAVLQFAYVALEGAGMIHGAGESDTHHEQWAMDAPLDTDELIPVASEEAHQENCDHCCHCHGHGSHFSPIFNPIALSIHSPTVLPSAYIADFQSTPIDAIHRPPIV